LNKSARKPLLKISKAPKSVIAVKIIAVKPAAGPETLM
jgi:hypothetical protein